MPSETSPAPPSAPQLLEAAVFTSTVRCLPGRWLPPYSVPVRCGIPIPPGKLSGGEAAWLIGPCGEILPAQTEVLGKWPDGSTRWILVETLIPLRDTVPQCWTAAFLPRNGTAVPTFQTQSGWRLEIVDRDGSLKVFPAESDLALLESLPPNFGSSNRPLTMTSVRQISCGPVQSSWVVSGRYPAARNVRVELRCSLFGEAGLLRVDITWHNPNRARHSGGLWDLGDAGSVEFPFAGWHVRSPGGFQNHIEYQLEPSGAWFDSTPKFEIHQSSSGGEHWDSLNHVDRHSVVPVRHRGHRLGWPPSEKDIVGRATPSVRVQGPQMSLTATIENFWQQFPKGLAAAPSGVDFQLFPMWPEDGYELQGGERKTHTIWLKLDPPGTERDKADLSWVHDPPRLMPVLDDQSWMPGWPRLSPLDPTPVSRLDSLCDEALNGPKSVFARREEIDEYGWRNFGEFFADHETAYYQGEPPLISHFNNQYDVLGGLLLQGLRTENRQWWELADDLMRHITDIDLYHTTEDRAMFNGGLFWLTDHYKSCGTATHRSFSKINARPGQPYGGGPGCEHSYSTGLLAYHWLTGEPAAKEAVVQLANWVIAMEEGRHTVFGLVDDGPTGFATYTAQPEYHGPGRGAGNSVNALLDGWLLTGDRTYLRAAEGILRRCIHPQDEIGARNLLNFELRWSYTVFLMAVNKYLQCKEELQEFDAEFEYARQSFLHYAQWMLDNERPYFERSEQMEFPTETWGAQELRKANVFRWAAVYADEPLHSQLRAEGLEFAERAWHDLCRFPTRTFIRPFTLAMIQGLWDAALRADERVCPQRGPARASWGEPTAFVPQSLRVKRMLKSPRGIVTAALRAMNPRRWVVFVDALRRML